MTIVDAGADGVAMSDGDDAFGWRPPRHRDIRDTFGKRRPPEYGRASRSPEPSWPSRHTSNMPLPASQPSRPEPLSSCLTPQDSRPVQQPLRSDDVVRHELHGIGVVIATDTIDCQVRVRRLQERPNCHPIGLDHNADA